MIEGGKEGFKGSKLSDNTEGMEKVPSKEIQSSALDDPKINYIDGKDNRLKKEYDQILDDVEAEFENLGIKPDKISGRGDKKILVYGKDKESEWVEDAISELPEGMCRKTSWQNH